MNDTTDRDTTSTVDQTPDTIGPRDSQRPRRYSRRKLLAAAGGLAAGIPLASQLLAACTNGGPGSGATGEALTPDSEEHDHELETPSAAIGRDGVDYTRARYGGTLQIALIDEPPTLDIHQTTAANTAFVGWHIFEALFTWDEDFHPIPEMLDRYEASADGLSHFVGLRPDLRFHDGTSVTIRDVIASVERWGRLSGLGNDLVEVIADIAVEDELSAEFQMSEPFGTFPIALARQNQGCAIYPRWAIGEVGDSSLQSFIGCGPYRFVEHIADRHIKLARNGGYVPAPGEVDGYGGHKYGFLDELVFVPVPDDAARVAGLQAGDYHYLESITPDHFPTVEDDPSIVVEKPDACCWPNLVLNLRSPLLSNHMIRRAVQVVLDHESILLAGYGEGFYHVDPSLMPPGTPWYSTSGEEYFNIHDVDHARILLEEAEYDGTPVRFMITQAYRDLYNSAIVIGQQLEVAGFNVNLEVYDWATMVQHRDNPDMWDLYMTLATFRPDPIMRNLTCEAPGWWCDPDKEELLRLLQAETDFDSRFEVWEQVQRMYYEQVPRIKLGDTHPLIVRSPVIQNFPRMIQLQPSFWNAWLEE
jgi:peptide/nickel transport system substrate-binding protein